MMLRVYQFMFVLFTLSVMSCSWQSVPQPFAFEPTSQAGLSGGLSGGLSEGQSTAQNNIIMFSTDYGLGIINGASNGPDKHAADVDDAYALSLALIARLDVRGIITSYGNDKARPSFESVRRGVNNFGFDSGRVYTGSEGFLDAVPIRFVPPGNTPAIFCINEGVEAMKATLDAQQRGVVTLFAIGPFTDIACLRRAYPESYSKLKEIIGLVGSLDGAPVINNIPVVDFNFAMDPAALGLVIQNSPVPITFILFEVSQLGSLTLDSLQAWQRSASKMQQYYASASIPHAMYWNKAFDINSGQALFDAHTVYYFLNPDAYLCEDNMLATASINNYPDLSAKTSNNTLLVESQANIGSVGEAVTGNSVSGFVRGCYGFKNARSVQQFEQAVKSSIM